MKAILFSLIFAVSLCSSPDKPVDTVQAPAKDTTKVKIDSVKVKKPEVTKAKEDTTTVYFELELKQYYRDRLALIKSEQGNLQQDFQKKIEVLQVRVDEITGLIYSDGGIDQARIVKANLHNDKIILRLKPKK